MGYRDRADGYKGISYGGGALALVALAFGLRMCSTMAGSISAAETPATVEAKLLADPDAGALFDTIKRTYPAEFDHITLDMLARTKAGATRSELQEALLTDLIEAGRRHNRDMLQAPHAAFAAYRRAEIAVVESLQTASPPLCAQYLKQGSFRSNDPNHLPAKVLIDFRQATWEANAAGRDHPVHRVVARPNAATWRTIATAMSAGGLSTSAVRSFFDEAALRRATPDEQCALGLGFLRAVDTLPGDRGDDFYASMSLPST